MPQKYQIWLQHVNSYKNMLHKNTFHSLIMKFECTYCPIIDGKKICIFKEYPHEMPTNINKNEFDDIKKN